MKLYPSVVGAVALFGLVGAQTAVADGHMAKLYGSLGAQIISVDGKDLETKVSKARVGIKGKNKGDFVTTSYNIEVDFDNDINGSSDEVDVRNAQINLGTRAGTFVFGKVSSGQYGDMVSYLDIFDYHGPLMNQGSKSNRISAYKTPVMGGLYGVIAFAADGADNGEDADIVHYRVAYKGKGIHAGAGVVDYKGIDKKRTNIGASYKRGAIKVAAGLEDDEKVNTETMGVVGTYGMGKTAISLGYFDKDDKSAANKDGSSTVVNISRSVSKNTRVYLEVGSTDTNVGNDATVVGVSTSF